MSYLHVHVESDNVTVISYLRKPTCQRYLPRFTLFYFYVMLDYISKANQLAPSFIILNLNNSKITCLKFDYIILKVIFHVENL